MLWIDDDLTDQNATLYSRTLEAKLTKAGLGRIEVRALPNASDAVVGLFDDRITPEVIILDWSFHNSTITAEQVLSALMSTSPAVPIYVYTAVARPEQVRNFPNVRQLVEKPDLDALVAAVANQLRKAPPVALVVSDLHFGRQHGHGEALTYTNLIDSFQHEFEDLGRRLRPNMLIVCGDLTSSGARDEFASARQFLGELCSLAGIPRSSAFIVPGNHDVFLTESYAYDNYRDFLERFYADVPGALSLGSREEVHQDELAFVRSVPGVAATVVGFSSTFVSEEPDVRISGYPRGTVGSILTSQMNNLSDQLRAFGPADGSKIAVLHHPLFPVPTRQQTLRAHRSDDSRVVTGQALLLNWLAQHEIQIVFHGHSHYPAARTVINHYTGRWSQPRKPIHVIASGTSGAADHAEAFHEHHYAVARILDGRRIIINSRVLSHDSGSWTTEPEMSIDLEL